MSRQGGPAHPGGSLLAWTLSCRQMSLRSAPTCCTISVLAASFLITASCKGIACAATCGGPCSEEVIIAEGPEQAGSL